MDARTIAVPVLVGLILVVAAPGGAQSLAEVARKEAERRGTTGKPGKVYTNENLTPDFTKPPEPPPAPTGAAVRDPAAGADAKADPAVAAPAHGAPTEADQAGVTPRDEQEPQPTHDKDEDYWRGRANLIRSRLNKQNSQILDLQKQAASFPNGSTSPERDIAVRALRKAQDDLGSLNDEWTRFERQARERNVPDAWIR